MRGRRYGPGGDPAGLSGPVPSAAVTVRAAVPADVPVIVALLRALAAEQGDETAIDEASLGDALFGGAPAVARADVAVADATGAVVGAAVWFPTYSTYLAREGVYLQDLYVLPAHRRDGHGRALMAALADRAGDGRVEWSVVDGNDRAGAFYRSLGAHPHDGWTTWHWLPRRSADGPEPAPQDQGMP